MPFVLVLVITYYSSTNTYSINTNIEYHQGSLQQIMSLMHGYLS